MPERWGHGNDDSCDTVLTLAPVCYAVSMPARSDDGTVTGIDVNVGQVAVTDGHRARITAKQVVETGIRSLLLVSCSLGGRTKARLDDA